MGSTQFLHGCPQKDASNAFLTAIFTTSPEKREALATYWVGTFVSNIKSAARLKNNFNLKHMLRFSADKFRCSLPDDVAFKMCALFTHFAPEFRRVVTPENWAKLVARLRRGGLDSELQEKVAVEKPDLKLSDFRFLQAFDATLPSSVFSSSAVETLDAQQAQAELNREEAQLAEAGVLIQREQGMWRAYMEAKAIWQASSQAQQGVFTQEQDAKNTEIIKKECDLRYPSRELESLAHIHAFVQSSVQAWVDSSTMDKDQVYQVWLLNLTAPGSKFQRSALTAITKAADQIAQCPERSAFIVFCPNTGTFGDQYSTNSTRKARKDVEEMLQDPDLRIIYRELVWGFDEETLATQSSRPSTDSAFMAISDQRAKDNEQD